MWLCVCGCSEESGNGDQLCRVTGLFPHPSPTSEAESIKTMLHKHHDCTKPNYKEDGGPSHGPGVVQQGVQGSFLSVGWDGHVAHWLPLMQTTTFHDEMQVRWSLTWPSYVSDYLFAHSIDWPLVLPLLY